MDPRRSCFALAFALAACGGGASASPSPSPSAAVVQTATSEQGSIYPKLSLPGAIAPEESVAISSSVDEPAAAVYVREGERVRAGQVLAQLAVDDLESELASAQETATADDAKADQAADTETLTIAQASDQVRQANSQVLEAKQTLAEAQVNLGRDQSLVSQGYLPQLNLDEQRVVVRNDSQALFAAEAALHSALANRDVTGTPAGGLQEATVRQARHEAAAQYAQADQIRRQIARAKIVSPVDGIVTNRNLNPGEYPSGRQLFTIEANDTVYAILTASSVQAYEVAAGDVVSVVRANLPRDAFTGRVVAVLDAATAGSTNFTVKVTLPNLRDALRAGTPVDATLSLQPVTGVVIPVSAFTDDSRSAVVTVVEGRTRTVRVTESGTDGTSSVVTGLPAGSTVVTQGNSGLSDGEQVVASK